MWLARSEEIREIDRRAVEKYQIPESELMERAGTGIAQTILKKFPHVKKVVVVVGKGKNGGDGRVVAKKLSQRGVSCRVVVGNSEALAGAELIVDALLGIGLSRSVRGEEKLLIEAINQVRQARQGGCKVVAVDIPSGLSADTGCPWGSAVQADLTCTVGVAKVGLYIGEGPRTTGEVVPIDIGYPAALLDEVKGRLLSPTDFRPVLMPRDPLSHKGTYGHLLLIGGSLNRLGAPLLAARAALRTGVGLLTLALPDRCYQKIPRGLLEAMYEPLPSTPVGRLKATALNSLRTLMEGKGCVAVGPGLGVTPDIKKIVRGLLKSKASFVFDADALNAIGTQGDCFKIARSIVITPHPGEMGRLTDQSASEVQKDRLGVTLGYARHYRVIVVLKGFHTLIGLPDGRYFVNPTGNPGMATAGMGDVLTGMIGALCAARSDFLQAVLAAVYLHGLAGDRVANRLGDRGLLASDVIEEIPLTVKDL